VLWTDAPAPRLEKMAGTKPPGYPEDLPANFDELTDLWDGQTSPMHPSWKRLLMYAPDVFPWTEIANYWDQCLMYPSRAGMGLGDQDYRTILDAIAKSV
jgi:hypothetical protein